MLGSQFPSAPDQCDICCESVRPGLGVVTTETATVYRSGGRRWLTRRGATAAALREIARDHCRCDGETRYTCEHHTLPPPDRSCG